jgi:catechol 2,3-dioxygenase-like lactoylglutathione lyase family enzyme
VTGMNLSLSHCFVTVHDQDEALTFYRDVIGLELRNDVPFEGFRWVTVSPPAQPDLEIVLETPNMGRPARAREALEQLMGQGALSGVLFRTDDVDATFEKIRASGAEVLQEPIDQPYGVRDCAFRDPSGNQIRISSSLT